MIDAENLHKNEKFAFNIDKSVDWFFDMNLEIKNDQLGEDHLHVLGKK